MKKICLIALGLFYFVSGTFADTVSSQIDNIYSTYVKPISLSLVVLFILIGGVANIGEIRQGGEAAKKGFMSWGLMALYGVIIFVVCAGLKGIISAVM